MRRVLQILMCICFTLVLAADAAAGETSLVVHPDGSWEQYEDGSGLAENILSLGYICELGSDASAHGSFADRHGGHVGRGNPYVFRG